MSWDLVKGLHGDPLCEVMVLVGG